MAFRADLSNLWAIAEVTEETISYGINHNTAKMDERAWEFWEHVCSTHGTSPMRSEQDIKDYPARNAHLLAALVLMYAFTVCNKPKSKGRHFIKPSSALAYPLAIIRIFGRWGVSLCPASNMSPRLSMGFADCTSAITGLTPSPRSALKT